MIPKRRIIPVFVPHLGCPNDCVFCNQRSISGTLSPTRPEQVEGIIRRSLEDIRGGAAELAFYGGSFTAIPPKEQEALLGAAAPFIESGELECIRVSTRPDAIDDGTLERLVRFRVKTVELGAQSMDASVLERSKRGHSPDDTRRSAEKIKSAGLKLILQMMTGLPGSSPEKDEYTAREIAALAPDGVRIYPTVVVQDTELYRLWRSGEYREHTVEDAVAVCARLLEIFGQAGIPVIRLGLNPTDDLSGGQAAAGAYHPALGELCRSRVYLERARALMEPFRGRSAVTIFVPKGAVSMMVGQKRANILALRREFSVGDIKIRQREDGRDEISLQ